jgi:hypothetical protein
MFNASKEFRNRAPIFTCFSIARKGEASRWTDACTLADDEKQKRRALNPQIDSARRSFMRGNYFRIKSTATFIVL